MPRTTVRFEDLAVGDDVLSLSRVVTSDDVKRYADASGDQNPLHQDEDFARSVGFPGIIA
ncbi:MAG TPA: MaoC/PaaZ C-terminal domain-containing protein, partial [Actinomycetota bacterium]|nr:MaoC/PaaZ C-terminal domain-containing protein [Actinomycetota bacterium]